MTSKEIISEFISQASKDLDTIRDNYFVIGSAAMVLTGCKLPKIADINILMSSADANRLKELWEPKLKTDHVYQYERVFRSNSNRFDFGFIDAEVMGNLEVNAGQQWIPVVVGQFVTVEVNGHSLKVPTLKEQYRIYRFFGRPKDLEKAKIIADRLQHLR